LIGKESVFQKDFVFPAAMKVLDLGEIHLGKGELVSGIVRSKDDDPLGGVEVAACLGDRVYLTRSGEKLWHAKSSANGRWVIADPVPPSCDRITVWGAGSCAVDGDGKILRSERKTIEIREVGPVVFGRLGDYRPQGPYVVAVLRTFGPVNAGIIDVAPIDYTGKFTLRARDGESMQVGFYDPKTRITHWKEASETASPQEQVFNLPPTIQVSVTVFNESEKLNEPFAAFIIACADSKRLSRTDVFVFDGVAEVIHLSPGNYVVEPVALDPELVGRPKSMHLTDGQRFKDCQLIVERGRSVAVECCSETGEIIEGADVEAFRVKSEGFLVDWDAGVPLDVVQLQSKKTNSLGRSFWIERAASVEDGFYAFRIKKDGFVRSVMPSMSFRRSSSVTVLLTRGDTARVAISADDVPVGVLAQTHIGLRRDGKFWPTSRVSYCPKADKEIVEFLDLPAGLYDVVIGDRRSGWLPEVYASIQVVRGSVAEIGINLSNRRPVVGRVFLYEDGVLAPSQGILVAPRGVDIHVVQGIHLESDSGGVLDFALPAGEYVAMAGHQSANGWVVRYAVFKVPMGIRSSINLVRASLHLRILSPNGVPLRNQQVTVTSPIWGSRMFVTDERGEVKGDLGGPFEAYTLKVGDWSTEREPQLGEPSLQIVTTGDQ
jgi:hypothetical protein